MDEIVQYLTGIPAWYLATIDAADPTQPRVRDVLVRRAGRRQAVVFHVARQRCMARA